jgi:hypothetical protein
MLVDIRQWLSCDPMFPCLMCLSSIILVSRVLFSYLPEQSLSLARTADLLLLAIDPVLHAASRFMRGQLTCLRGSTVLGFFTARGRGGKQCMLLAVGQVQFHSK